MTRPDVTLIRWIQAGVNRVRTIPMTVVSTTHQVVEPRRTPSTTVAAPTVDALVTPRPANSAPNDRMVIGLAIVSARIERYAPAYPRRRVGAAVAASVGAERTVCHD